MHSNQAKHHARQRWAVVLALVCALLLIFGSTVQAVHVHSPADVSHPGCALCATAHVVVSPTAPASISVPAREITTAILDTEPAFAHASLGFSLYIRPPPVAIAFS